MDAVGLAVVITSPINCHVYFRSIVHLQSSSKFMFLFPSKLNIQYSSVDGLWVPVISDYDLLSIERRHSFALFIYSYKMATGSSNPPFALYPPSSSPGGNNVPHILSGDPTPDGTVILDLRLLCNCQPSPHCHLSDL